MHQVSFILQLPDKDRIQLSAAVVTRTSDRCLYARTSVRSGRLAGGRFAARVLHNSCATIPQVSCREHNLPNMSELSNHSCNIVFQITGGHTRRLPLRISGGNCRGWRMSSDHSSRFAYDGSESGLVDDDNIDNDNAVRCHRW